MLPKRQHLSFSPSYINTLFFTSSAAPRRVGGEQSAAIWAAPASGGGASHPHPRGSASGGAPHPRGTTKTAGTHPPAQRVFISRGAGAAGDEEARAPLQARI